MYTWRGRKFQAARVLGLSSASPTTSASTAAPAWTAHLPQESKPSTDNCAICAATPSRPWSGMGGTKEADFKPDRVISRQYGVMGPVVCILPVGGIGSRGDERVIEDQMEMSRVWNRYVVYRCRIALREKMCWLEMLIRLWVAC